MTRQSLPTDLWPLWDRSIRLVKEGKLAVVNDTRTKRTLADTDGHGLIRFSINPAAQAARKRGKT